jgi:hypothetical protein
VVTTTSGTAARRLARTAGLGAAALLLGLGAGVAPASATEEPETRTVPLKEAHEGATAEGFGDHECENMDAKEPGEDGFHFVVPGNDGMFHSLTVTFDTDPSVADDDPLVVELGEGDFGPPDAKHAYVFAPAGSVLESGEAEVSGGDKDEFNLSHTCPGTPEEEPTEEPTTEPTEEPTEEPTGEPTTEPTEGGGGGTTPTGEPTTSPTEGGGGGTTPTEEPTEAAPADDGSDTTGDQGSAVGGALADTGGNLPLLLGAAVALLVIGGVLTLTPARKVITGRHRR